MKKLIGVLLIAVVALAGLLSVAPASAYCEIERPDGSCTNGCIEAAKLYKKVTGRYAPWDCPM